MLTEPTTTTGRRVADASWWWSSSWHLIVPVGVWAVMWTLIGRVQTVVGNTDTDPGALHGWRLFLRTGPTLSGKAAWDSSLYFDVAERGYRPGMANEAVFPGYGLAIRLLNGLTDDSLTSAVWITTVCGLACVLLMWTWLHDRAVTPAVGLTAFAWFVTYPFAFLMYGVAYSDTFLMTFVLGAIVLVGRRQYLLAGLAGAVATASRPNSLVLVAALLLFALEQEGVLTFPSRDPSPGEGVRRLRPRAVGDALVGFVRGIGFRRDRLRWSPLLTGVSIFGVGAWSGWLWAERGDPFYFWTVQHEQYGHRTLTDPLNWLKANLLFPERILFTPLDAVNEVFSFALLVGAFLLVPRVGRRFGWGAAVLVLGTFLTTWLTAQWFAPAGRYMLPVVPFLLVLLAERLARRPRVAAALVGVFVVCSLGLAAGFAGAFDINW